MHRLPRRQQRKLEKDIVGWLAERWDLPVARQSRHDERVHVLVLLWAAAGNLFLESALTACGWLGVERLPSKRGLLYRLRRWGSRGELHDGLVRVNRRVLREARRRRSLPKGAVAAIDYSDTHYYGKTKRGACCRAPEKRGTGWFHRYAALSLIVRGGRYTVALEDAMAIPGNDPDRERKVLKEIGEAEKEMGRADADWNDLRYEHAICHLGQAWKHAQRAMKV